MCTYSCDSALHFGLQLSWKCKGVCLLLHSLKVYRKCIAFCRKVCTPTQEPNWLAKHGRYNFYRYRSSKGFPQALTFHFADAQNDTKNPPKFWVRSRHLCWAIAENTVHLKSRQLWFRLCFQLQKPWRGDPARAEPQATWQGMLDMLNRADT